MSKSAFSHLVEKIRFKKQNEPQLDQPEWKPNMDKIDSTIQKQIELIDLTEEDFINAKKMEPIIEENIACIVDYFYDGISKRSHLSKIVTDNSTFERLKKTLRKHIHELFQVEFDSTFYKKRVAIAHRHLKIGLATNWYIGSFQRITNGIIDALEENIEDKQLVIEYIKSATKLLNLEQQLVLMAFEEKTDELKTEVDREKEKIKNELDTSTQELAMTSEELKASVQEMTGQVEKLTSIAASNFETAEKTGETSEKGEESAKGTMQSSETVEEKMGLLYKTAEDLNRNSENITEITDLVKNISKQTNLLALNASIEAARAGEHGRGFAVVASEVGKLAESTQNSVEDIQKIIEQNNAVIRTISNLTDEMKRVIENMRDQIDHSNKQFAEIKSSTLSNIEASHRLEGEINYLMQMINTVNIASETVANSAEQLNTNIDLL